jgi:hypothetical protein
MFIALHRRYHCPTHHLPVPASFANISNQQNESLAFSDRGPLFSSDAAPADQPPAARHRLERGGIESRQSKNSIIKVN